MINSHKDTRKAISTILTALTIIAYISVLAFVTYGSAQHAKKQFFSHWKTENVTIANDPVTYGDNGWIYQNVTFQSFDGSKTLNGQIAQRIALPEGAQLANVWINDKNSINNFSVDYNGDVGNNPGGPGFPVHWWLPSLIGGGAILMFASFWLYMGLTYVALALCTGGIGKYLHKKRLRAIALGKAAELASIERQNAIEIAEAKRQAAYDAAYEAAKRELGNI